MYRAVHCQKLLRSRCLGVTVLFSLALVPITTSPITPVFLFRYGGTVRHAYCLYEIAKPKRTASDRHAIYFRKIFFEPQRG